MVGEVDTVANSGIVREASGMYPVSEEYISNDHPLYVALPPRREQGHRVLHMVSILCLSAAIFLLLRGHHCVLLLDSHGQLGGRLRERVLSLAETGRFRRCVESGTVLERAVPQGTGSDDLSTASGGSLRVSSEGISSGASSGFEGGPLIGAVGGTGTSGLPAPTLDESQYAQESIVHGSLPVSPHTAFQRILGRLGVSKKIPFDFAARQGPLETREGGISDQISTNERQQEKNSPTKKSVPSSKVLLDVPLDRAEHARQLRLLQPSGDVCVDMTEQDLDLLHTAKRHLTRMLNKRSHLLNSLHANSARQSLLQGQLWLQRSTSSERHRLQGRLLQLQEEARLLECQLWRTRRELKSMIPLQQHMALSLRLVARRRAAGAYLSSRGAAALSAAILIVDGSGREHAVASYTEELEIKKMSVLELEQLELNQSGSHLILAAEAAA
ncbi:hypothetical protein, conserved [Eimeria maxima]|uniref:Uncharacterized protein n=1 Tax=Eimeria maxima TaxID=5804 RepID=U6M4P0_EIMMA|nr:hypothetical protein, conserved [Eimeria maxima]CDJ59187.1 hypothetical protein, conserved [Eimeria maxima]